jgi:hypothetical protein
MALFENSCLIITVGYKAAFGIFLTFYEFINIDGRRKRIGERKDEIISGTDHEVPAPGRGGAVFLLRTGGR